MNSTYQAEPKSMKKLLLTAVLASALSACSDSNEPRGSLASNTDAPVLDALKAQGLTIHGPLDVPGGLDAFAASAGTQALAVYVMPDSGYALIGTLIDEAGNPVADEELRRIVSEPLEQGAWDSLEAAGWVGDGRPDAERIVYVFTDANCPFCNQLWTSARPWVEAGMVQLRHVMVGVIRADSAAKAAAILEAEDPEAALAFNEVHHSEGGIVPLETISDESNARLNANVELMRQLGFGGTPGLIAKSDDGSLKFQSGVPRGAALEELFGPL
ncbi:thiol:disulfide interchange protein DsbG [Aquamicrobium sp. NLF2-7]|uniref:thiol:disulfide interchange protein DsbG n=1 Tax=Aquamicrobium sp. NLF2-7 TaxID=2918753 RepID=UPI001EFBB152|nr:thiol:disulfide interchange protein DsbG [Aquamicrobium sp. NLF2-7]MCG8274295.1 thiol:disulfide interchange protein DsbG [Aquamicrobium sp. NLF2-7]